MKSVEEKAKECVGGCTCDFEKGFAWDGKHLENCIIKRVAQALTAHAKEVAEPLESKIRYLLWTGHGCEMLYGDDGEMQCNNAKLHGFLDFKRQSIEILEESILLGKIVHYKSQTKEMR